MQDENTTECRTVSNTDPDSMFCPEKINKKLTEVITNFALPEWILYSVDGAQRKCAECGENLEPISIRTVSLCLNPQHVGDIQVEILCRKCSSAYYINFRKSCLTTNDFVRLLTADRPPFDPVRLTSIDHNDNNLTTLMIEEDIDKIAADIATDVAEKMVGYGKQGGTTE